MEYMANACSTTARRGALDWAPIFEETTMPVFEKLYESVKNGTETRKALEFNGRPTYRQDLAKELREVDEQEIWRVGMALMTYLNGSVTFDTTSVQAKSSGRFVQRVGDDLRRNVSKNRHCGTSKSINGGRPSTRHASCVVISPLPFESFTLSRQTMMHQQPSDTVYIRFISLFLLSRIQTSCALMHPCTLGSF